MKEILLDAVFEASKVILNYYKTGDFQIETKSDSSPLTDADKKADEILHDWLSSHFVYPIQSEEKEVSYDKRKNWEKFWLVDPLDGSKEFINGTDDFTINVALIQEGNPLAGIIYHPCSGEAFYAERGKGTVLIDQQRNERKLNVSLLQSNDLSKMVQSRSHPNPKEINFVNNNKAVDGIIKMGSSLKFCALTKGSGGIYARYTPSKEWDIAAGHIIATEAGLKIYDLETMKEPVYNKKNILNNSFVVYNPTHFDFDKLCF
jgi:3'(2'), 5'-bisphosphate nucleotidase